MMRLVIGDLKALCQDPLPAVLAVQPGPEQELRLRLVSG